MSKTAGSDESGTSDPAGADDVASLHRRLLVPTLVLTGSLLAVVSSLGAPLIPTLSRVDGVSLSTGEWILTIALLTGALATPVMGRLADGPRQREVILIPLGAVLVGCVLAAVSNGFTVLIIGPPEPPTREGPPDHRYALGHSRHRRRPGVSADRAARPGPGLPGRLLVWRYRRCRSHGPSCAGPARPFRGHVAAL
jgi:hypothetical protein